MIAAVHRCAVRIMTLRIVSSFRMQAIGTTHPRDVDLSRLTAPVTKIVGTRDGIAKPEGVETNRAKLPAATDWVWVEGGNHSQFGWYGFQPGDRRATVPADVQHTITIRAVLQVLAQVRAVPPAS